MQTGPKDVVHSTKARENGLCVSLLERIHAIYSNLDDSTCLKTEYMASLLTNYRCHEGTLYLCSTGSTRVRSGEGLCPCASCNGLLHPAPTSAQDDLNPQQLALVVVFLPPNSAKTSLALAVDITCNLSWWCFSCIN